MLKNGMKRIESFATSWWQSIDFSSPRIINSFKTALACVIGYLLVLWTPLPEAQWIVITILVVMSAQTSIGSLFIKATMRFWGTVCGTLASAAVLLLCGHNPVALGIAIFVITLFFSYIAAIPGDVSYIGTLGSVTLIIIILSDHPSLTVAGERFIEISLGIIISFLVSNFILPIRSHSIFIKNVMNTLSYLHEYFDGCFHDHAMITNEKMLSVLMQQRRLIHETGLELGKSRQDKAIFLEMFNAERKIYRAVNLIHESFHATPESQEIILSLPGLARFKQEVSQYLVQLSHALQSGVVKEVDFLSAELMDFMEHDFKEIMSSNQYPQIVPVLTFLFSAKLLMKELKILTEAVEKINYLHYPNTSGRP